MKKKVAAALSLSFILLGSTAAMAAPEYPPVPGTGPESRAVVSFSSNSTAVAARFLPRLSALELSGKSVITITGYTAKTKSAKADRALALKRANSTLKLMRTIAPKAKYVVVSKGSTYTATCKSLKNNCTIVTVKG
jgi:outer membrane protein OmpA-like peptidoglycan-associated protein